MIMMMIMIIIMLYALQAKSASIDATKGVGGVTPKQLYIFFQHIHVNREKQLLKKLFYCS